MCSKHAVVCDDGGMSLRCISPPSIITFFECDEPLHSQALLAYRKFSGDCSCNPNLPGRPSTCGSPAFPQQPDWPKPSLSCVQKQSGGAARPGGVGLSAFAGAGRGGVVRPERRSAMRRIGASRAAACALSTATAASSAAAWSTKPAASGRRAFAIASWKSAVPVITFACG